MKHLLLFSLAFVMLLSANSAYSTETIGATIIDEDFSTDASANFTVVKGGWSFGDGRYYISNRQDATPIGNLTVHNTDLTANFILSSIVHIRERGAAWNLWHDAAVIFNYQNADNFYYVNINQSIDDIGLYKNEAGVASKLASIDAVVTYATDYAVEVTKKGKNIFVKLDDVLVAEVIDATFTGGKAGFGSRNDPGEFDDLLVRNIEVTVDDVTVAPTVADILIGDTKQLTANVIPYYSDDIVITWSSNNEGVATVDVNGLVTAHNVGTATITVETRDGGYTATCAVAVKCPGVEKATGMIIQAGVGEVTLNWDGVENADGYIISYGTTEGVYTNNVEIANGQTDYAIIDGLTNETIYYFVIVTKQGICISEETDAISATPTATLTEYTNRNVVVSTIGSGKNLGSGFKAIRIIGHPNLEKGFNSYTTPINFLIDIDAPNADTDLDACLTISYDESNLPEGLNLNMFDMYRFNEVTNIWEKIDATFDMDNKKFTLCEVDEFSMWTLAGSAPESVPLENWGILLVLIVLAGGVALKLFR